MLSLLYLEIARSAGVPVYGVNLPEHFVLCYRDELNDPVNINDHSKILFYINPLVKEISSTEKRLTLFTTAENSARKQLL